MISLLIVDDEQDITDSLYMNFKQMEMEEFDIYKAYSAYEALEWLNRTKIDIVLSDIRMPGMSGLELLGVIKKKWPECKVIFLTGYDEFDYVYTAIKYNDVSYLLKTEGYDEIVKSVQNAISEIQATVEINELIDTAKEQMSIAQPLLQKQYMIDMLSGIQFSAEAREKKNEELALPLDPAVPVLLLVGGIDNPEIYKAGVDRQQVLYMMNLISEKYLSPKVRNFYAAYDHTTLLWVIQPSEEDVLSYVTDSNQMWNEVGIYIKGILENIQAACKSVLGISISFVIDDKQSTWEEMSERFNYLKLLLNYRVGSGINMRVIDSRFLKDGLNTEELDIPDISKFDSIIKRIKEMEGMLDNGNKQVFFETLTTVTASLIDVKSKNHNPSLEIYYSLSILLLSYINRWNLTEKIAFKIGLNKLTRADAHNTWKEAVDYLFSISEIIFDIQQDEEEKRAQTAVSRIKKYIDEHLGEDLSLVRLAELVHFNPSYLSRLFKQVAGQNLLTYISEARLNKSRELLLGSNLKINEIAVAVGYISAPYFTRFFKKAVHLSPQEFRDINLNK